MINVALLVVAISCISVLGAAASDLKLDTEAVQETEKQVAEHLKKTTKDVLVRPSPVVLDGARSNGAKPKERLPWQPAPEQELPQAQTLWQLPEYRDYEETHVSPLDEEIFQETKKSLQRKPAESKPAALNPPAKGGVKNAD